MEPTGTDLPMLEELKPSGAIAGSSEGHVVTKQATTYASTALLWEMSG